MITTILHWTCDSTSASMASLLFRWAIALAMLPYGVQKLFHPENATKFPKVFFFSPRVGYYSAAIIETFVPLFLMAGFLTGWQSFLRSLASQSQPKSPSARI